MALPTSTGSISTYRNKQRACCQSRTASSYLHTVRMSIFLGFSSNSCTAFTGDLLVTWTLRSIAVGMSQRHALSDGSGCEGVTEVMEPHAPKSYVIPSPKYYDFPMGRPGQSPLYLLYYSDNSNKIIPIPLILFRNATM